MTPEEHFCNMAQFIKGAELAGGTDPHLAMVVSSMENQEDLLEKLWFAGCYALVYNWPTAERIFLEWRPESFSQPDFLMWAEEKWDGIFLRKERKAVFRKPFFAESAASYLAFARWLVQQDSWPTGYGAATEMFTGRCRYMGRYIAARWVEVMRRAFNTGWVMPEPGSAGGQHPRKALALIYPADAEALLGGDTKEEVRISDQVFDRFLLDLKLEYGLDIDYYTAHSLLCEYKQSVLGKKQYPGKSLDSEVDYFNRVYGYWGPDAAMESAFYPIRAAGFPHRSLGEMNGWVGVRPGLGESLADNGITWSDYVYDYPATTDLASPVLRNPSITSLKDLM